MTYAGLSIEARRGDNDAVAKLQDENKKLAAEVKSDHDEKEKQITQDLADAKKEEAEDKQKITEMKDDETKKEMRKVLADIQGGKFARDWMLENKVNQTSFKATRAKLAAHPIEEVGAKLRDMMPWIKKGALVDKSKN